MKLDNVFESPQIVSGGGGENTSISVSENQSFVTYVNAVSPESDNKFYSANVNRDAQVLFSGEVFESGGAWDTNSSISFGTDISTGTIFYPIHANGVFNPNVQIPHIAVSFTSGGSITDLSATYYGGYKNTGVGFAGGAPQIIIQDPDGGGIRAEATAIVSSGEIIGFNVLEGMVTETPTHPKYPLSVDHIS